MNTVETCVAYRLSCRCVSIFMSVCNSFPAVHSIPLNIFTYPDAMQQSGRAWDEEKKLTGKR